MLTPAVRFRVDFGPHCALGPGKVALLEHIGRSGSLSQAARALRMSYRRAWQLLASLNADFRERVAETSKGGRGGGGARLTPFGLQLIRVYRNFEADLQNRAAWRFRTIAGAARAGRRPAGGRATTRPPAAPVRRISAR